MGRGKNSSAGKRKRERKKNRKLAFVSPRAPPFPPGKEMNESRGDRGKSGEERRFGGGRGGRAEQEGTNGNPGEGEGEAAGRIGSGIRLFPSLPFSLLDTRPPSSPPPSVGFARAALKLFVFQVGQLAVFKAGGGEGRGGRRGHVAGRCWQVMVLGVRMGAAGFF